MKRKTTNHQIPVPCRAVSVVLSRNRGTPISTSIAPALGGVLPCEEALLGMGLFGMTNMGRPFARVGIYNFEPNGPVFKFAVNFNTDDGSPVFKPERGTHRSLSEAEMCLVNWVQGALFEAELGDGDYHMKVDRPNAAGEPDLDEARDIQKMCRTLPGREAFAAERRLESAVELFREHLERKEDAPTRQMMKVPERIPLISPDQVPSYLVKDGQLALPIYEASVAPKAFVSFAVNRFSSGLRSQTGQYREIKAGFIKAFNVADALLKKGNTKLTAGMMERSIASIQAAAKAHVATLDRKRFKIEEVAKSITASLESLRTYYTHRHPDMAVKMYSPGSPSPDSATQQKVAELFRNPMFTAVHAVPVQIFSDYWSTGEFPFYGAELFEEQSTK